MQLLNNPGWARSPSAWAMPDVQDVMRSCVARWFSLGWPLLHGPLANQIGQLGDLAQAMQPKIGKVVDDAMLAIERDNPSLKGVLPKDYAHPRLDKQRLGQLIDLVGNILGTMIDRVHRDLTDDDIRQIADTYHAWRGDKSARAGSVSDGKKGESVAHASGSLKPYEDVLGFCKSATLDDIRHHGHILTPGRYVGAAEVEDDGEPFEDKMARLTADLGEQRARSWDEPASGTCYYPLNSHFSGFATLHGQVANFGFGDGSVRLVSQTVDLNVYWAMSTMDEGDVLSVGP